MSDRLPDEAVEAMARALCDLSNRREQENYDRGMNGDARPCFLSYDEWREEFDENASAALAALPAGVYVSDGKGRVEFAPLVERGTSAEKTVIDSALFSVIERVAAERDAAVLRLAALSATDTEKAGE